MVTNLLRSKIIYFIAIVLLIVYIPNLPPYAKVTEPHIITPALPFEGKLALNEKLGNAEKLFEGKLHGPEAFAVYDGELYTSLLTGDVVKLVGNNIVPIVKFGKACKGFHEEHICGRPLGLTFDKNGFLYVADAYYGIFKVDVKSGKYEQLVSTNQAIENEKPKLPNCVAVAQNGDVYWTDSSTQFHLLDGLFDALSDGSGRLIHYDAKTKKNKVLLKNFHFINGVALSKDESFLVVAETARNRLHRYYLKGAQKGKTEVFLDGLPGMPDNIQPDGKGGFFVPLVTSSDSENPHVLLALSQFPLIRKFIVRVFGLFEHSFKLVNQVYPNIWCDKAVHQIGSFHSMWNLIPTSKRLSVLRVDESGQIIESLHALDGKVTSISDVIVFKDALYLGSPFNDFVARVSLSKAGLTHLAAVKTDTPKPNLTESPPTPKKTQSPPKTTQTPPTTTQAPPTTTQAPPTTTQAPPKPTQAPPKPTQTPPKPTQAPPKPTQTPPKPTQAPPKPTQTPPKPTQAPPKPTQAPPKPTQTPPKPTQDLPKTNQASPKTTTPAPAKTEPPKTTPAPSKTEADQQPKKSTTQSHTTATPEPTQASSVNNAKSSSTKTPPASQTPPTNKASPAAKPENTDSKPVTPEKKAPTSTNNAAKDTPQPTIPPKNQNTENVKPNTRETDAKVGKESGKK